jgi:membrane-associated phospholipid phosphatase
VSSGAAPLRTWLAAGAACTAAVLASMAWVDRPVADYVEAHFRGTSLFEWTTRALSLLPPVLFVLLVGLVTGGVLALRGRAMPAWTRLPMLCGWSVALALSAAVALKRVFGRSWADLYTARGVYEFHPLRGGYGFEAFPSGTTTVAGALLAVIWIRVPGLRRVSALLLAVIAVALVITNSHWVSDVIAGGYLGAAIGAMTVRMLGGERPLYLAG